MGLSMSSIPPKLEINADHVVIKSIYGLKSNQSTKDLAKDLALQVIDNAKIAAGLLSRPQTMLTRLNNLLELVATHVYPKGALNEANDVEEIKVDSKEAEGKESKNENNA
jgi:hypothetical protein